jgi:ammonia channel protein AmtB
MICKYTTGLRVPEQEEREGLDIGTHGERAYS